MSQKDHLWGDVSILLQQALNSQSLRATFIMGGFFSFSAGINVRRQIGIQERSLFDYCLAFLLLLTQSCGSGPNVFSFCSWVSRRWKFRFSLECALEFWMNHWPESDTCPCIFFFDGRTLANVLSFEFFLILFIGWVSRACIPAKSVYPSSPDPTQWFSIVSINSE